MVGLDLRAKLAQAVLIELGEGEAAIAGKATTTHAFRQENIVGAQLGQIDQVVGHAHLTGRTSYVQSNRTIDGMEIEAWHQILHDELTGLVEMHLMHHLLHTVQARALSTENGVLALLGSLPQGGLEFGTLAVGNVKHTLRLPNLSAAHTFHTFGEYHLVAGLSHQLDNLVYQVMNLSAMF